MNVEYLAVAANAREGGAAAVAEGLITAASRMGAPIHFVIPAPLARRVRTNPERVTVLGSGRSSLRLLEARNTVVRMNPRAVLLLDNLPLLTGLPEVVLVHNALLAVPGAWRRNVRAAWLRIWWPKVRSFVAPSRTLAEALQEIAPRVPCTAIPHGVDIEPAPRVLEAEPTLLYVGHPYPYKNLAVLVEALHRLPDAVRLQWTLDLADKRTEPLQRRARALAVEDRISWLGELDRDAVRRAYARSHVFVYPSDIESFGLPLAEALRCGVPVVTSDRRWAREVCGSTALYCDPHDPDQLAAAVARLLDDRQLFRRLSEDGRRWSCKYDWGSTLQQYLAVLAEAAEVPQGNIG